MKRIALLLVLLAAPCRADDPAELIRLRVEVAALRAIAEVKRPAPADPASTELRAEIDALNQRLDAMETRGVNAFAEILGRLPPAASAQPPHDSGGSVNDHSSGVVTPQPPAAAQDRPAVQTQTTVCRCEGYRESVCLCRKAGQTCHCSRTSGSVWERAGESEPWRKTTAKADPREKSKPPPEVSGDGIPVERRSDGRDYWLHPVYGLRYATGALVEGGTYLDLVYRDGRMYPQADAPAATKIKPIIIQPSGHWATQCVNGVCTPVWIPNR